MPATPIDRIDEHFHPTFSLERLEIARHRAPFHGHRVRQLRDTGRPCLDDVFENGPLGDLDPVFR